VSERRDVLHDAALGMLGVFRPLRREPQRAKLDEQTFWGGASIRWRGPDQLSIGDQSVLFAVLEVASEQLRQAAAQIGPEDPLWEMLLHQQHVFSTQAVRVATNFSRLSKLCGWGDGGAALSRVKSSLRRLTETTVWVRRDELEGSSRMLAWQAGNQREVLLVLNWRFAQALHGQHYSRISMAERALLGGEAAQALHAVLSCKVDPKKAWSCKLDGLQRYVWGTSAMQGDVLRARRKRLRAALKDIGQLRGWTVHADEDTVRIARGPLCPVVSVTPRRFVHDVPSLQSQSNSAEPSKHAGFQLVDASVLFSTRE
jgi:hypothetical protein